MGWSWAFWLVQRAHLELVRQAGVPQDRVAFGSRPFPQLQEGPAEVPYCDSIMVVGTSAEAVTALRDRVLKWFEDAGFAMHE
eukprot:3168162-Heterocapsa_arctica.AAC.1